VEDHASYLEQATLPPKEIQEENNF